jgi:hypothetical protein
MEFNLRKARKLESSLLSYLSQELILDSKASIRSLGNLEQANQAILTKKNDLFSNIDIRVNILSLIYKIRRLVEIANEESGINILINKKVLNQKILDDLQTIERSETPSSEELLDMLLASSKNLNSGSDSDSILRRSIKTSFTVSCLSKDDLDMLSSQKASIHKEQQAIDEDINYLNITKKIILNEEDTKILELCKLL